MQPTRNVVIPITGDLHIIELSSSFSSYYTGATFLDIHALAKRFFSLRMFTVFHKLDSYLFVILVSVCATAALFAHLCSCHEYLLPIMIL